MSDQGVELVSYEFAKKVLTGTVKNSSADQSGSVWLKFDVFDRAGTKLGTVTPNTMVGPPAITSLGPGESWSFSFAIQGYAGRARSVKFVEIEARD